MREVSAVLMRRVKVKILTHIVIAGFSVGYFQEPWGAKSGFGLSFGIQAIIVAAAVGIIALLQIFGGRMRAKGGQVR